MAGAPAGRRIDEARRDRTISQRVPRSSHDHPGSDTSAGQPGTPQAPWTPPQSGQPYQPQGAQPQKKGGAKKWLGATGAVVVIGTGAAYQLTGGFGIGDVEVGDCVQMQGATTFEVVDCDAAEAEYKVVGVEEQKQTYDDFQVDPESCMQFATAEVALWTGEEGEEGTVTCAEPV
ncbi:MAG TPA: hypothetical protein VK402_05755 [Blastococcus sp.]|nr:hypothetical protein [Blastococcus sp.]